MNIFMGGNPLATNDDNTPIYALRNFIPPSIEMESFPEINSSEITDFLWNLYYVVMEENGMCYFYPNFDDDANICRYEWHYDFRGQKYGLRVGLLLVVEKNAIKQSNYFIQPHDAFKEVGENDSKNKVKVTVELSQKETLDILEFLQKRINTSLRRILSVEKETFNHILYMKFQRPIFQTVQITKNVTLLESRNIGGKFVSALIISVEGDSFLSSKRFSDEIFNLVVATSSIFFGKTEAFSMDKLPLVTNIKSSSVDDLLKNTEKFYPEGDSNFAGLSQNSLDQENLTNLISIYKNIDGIEKGRRKLVNILFGYYSAIEAKDINKTLSLVAFTSCLEAIAKELYPDIKSELGSRKAIVHLIENSMDISNALESVEQWSKRIYNNHRSSYVHGANFKFEEYSQNMDGKQSAGRPKAIPVNGNIVSKQYEYESDYVVLVEATTFVLLKYINDLAESRETYPHNKDDTVDFSMRAIPEGYIGFINKGWMRI